MHSCRLPRNDHHSADTVAVCADCGKLHQLKPPDYTRTHPHWERVYSVSLPFPIVVIDGEVDQ